MKTFMILSLFMLSSPIIADEASKQEKKEKFIIIVNDVEVKNDTSPIKTETTNTTINRSSNNKEKSNIYAFRKKTKSDIIPKLTYKFDAQDGRLKFERETSASKNVNSTEKPAKLLTPKDSSLSANTASNLKEQPNYPTHYPIRPPTMYYTLCPIPLPGIPNNNPHYYLAHQQVLYSKPTVSTYYSSNPPLPNYQIPATQSQFSHEYNNFIPTDSFPKYSDNKYEPSYPLENYYIPNLETNHQFNKEFQLTPATLTNQNQYLPYEHKSNTDYNIPYQQPLHDPYKTSASNNKYYQQKYIPPTNTRAKYLKKMPSNNYPEYYVPAASFMYQSRTNAPPKFFYHKHYDDMEFKSNLIYGLQAPDFKQSNSYFNDPNRLTVNEKLDIVENDKTDKESVKIT